MTASMILDLIFLSVLVLSFWIGWHKGVFRIVAGIAGTVLGYFGARALAPRFSPRIAALLTPVTDQWITKAAADVGQSGLLTQQLHQALDGTGLASLLERLGLSEGFWTYVEQAAASGTQTVADFLRTAVSDSLAPIITFLLLFILIKLAVSLVCRFLSLDIPLLSQLNHTAGGLCGLLGGLLTIALCCAGILYFGGAGQLFTLSALQNSAIGGFFYRLFR